MLGWKWIFVLVMLGGSKLAWAGCEDHLTSIPTSAGQKLTPAALSFIRLIDYFQTHEPQKAEALVKELLKRDHPMNPFSELSLDRLEVQLALAVNSVIGQINEFDWKTKIKADLKTRLAMWQEVGKERAQRENETKIVVRPALVGEFDVDRNPFGAVSWLRLGQSTFVASVSSDYAGSFHYYLNLIDPVNGQLVNGTPTEILTGWRTMFVIESSDDAYVVGQGPVRGHSDVKSLQVLRYQQPAKIFTSLRLPPNIDSWAAVAQGPLKINGKDHLVVGSRGRVRLYQIINGEFVEGESVKLFDDITGTSDAERIGELSVLNVGTRSFAVVVSNKRIFLYEVMNGKLQPKVVRDIFGSHDRSVRCKIKPTVHKNQILVAIELDMEHEPGHSLAVLAYNMTTDRVKMSRWKSILVNGAGDLVWVPSRDRALLSVKSDGLELYEWAEHKLKKIGGYKLPDGLLISSLDWIEFEHRVFAGLRAEDKGVNIVELSENQVLDIGTFKLSGGVSEIAWLIDGRQAYMAASNGNKLYIFKLVDEQR